MLDNGFVGVMDNAGKSFVSQGMARDGEYVLQMPA